MVEARIRHFVVAAGRDGATTAILDDLRKKETAKKALIGQLEDLDRLTQVASRMRSGSSRRSWRGWPT